MNRVKRGIAPDLSNFADCEEKRHLQNLEQKLELHIDSMYETDDFEELKKMHSEGNEIWWEINAKMGALLCKVNSERKDDKRFRISLIFSIFALIMSIISLFK